MLEATSPNSRETRPRARLKSRISLTSPKFWLYTVIITDSRSLAVDRRRGASWAGAVPGCGIEAAAT